MEVVLDEDVYNKEGVEALGIRTGDIVCFDPRTRITDSGYIKSRFLDDKLSVAILMGYANYLQEQDIVPERRIYQHISVFEEVGHGCSYLPASVSEVLAVDMGCVGEGLNCTERQVSTVRTTTQPYLHWWPQQKNRALTLRLISILITVQTQTLPLTQAMISAMP